MGHQNNGHPRLVQLTEQVHHLVAGGGIQGAGGFIRQQQDRAVDDGPGNGHPLLLTATQLVGTVVEALPEAHPHQGLLSPLALKGAGNTGIHHGQHHVLQSRQLPQEVKLLEDKAQLPVAQTRQLVVVEAPGAVILQPVLSTAGLIQAAQNVHGGGFAATAGPHHRQIIPLAHLEGQTIQGQHPIVARAIGFAHVPQFGHNGVTLALKTGD